MANCFGDHLFWATLYEMRKTNLKVFDAQKVGRLDADMWRAYYNHQFLKLFRHFFLLLKTQMRLGRFLMLRLAYYAVWAAVDYRIYRKLGINSSRILKNLTKFYKLVSKHSVEPFNYTKAARLELAWWEVHRKSNVNNTKLEQTLAEAASTIYNISPEHLTKFARYRAEAMIMPRHRADGPDNPTNWAKVTELTIRSWEALHDAVQAGRHR